MASAAPSARAAIDSAETARLHFVFRFSFGTTAAFVVCEWMGWQPSALAPVLTGVLLANLPVSPPPKVGLALVIVMGKTGTFTGSLLYAVELYDARSNELLLAAVRRRTPDPLDVPATLSTTDTVKAIAREFADGARKRLQELTGAP